ncbi:MAG: type II glyceraldehyde-3-phosphate dehydrogenase [Pseudomonadota bacterium]
MRADKTKAANPIRVAVVGYGVIGKRVADAVVLQPDMRLQGVADVATDWRLAVARRLGHPVFAADAALAGPLRAAGVEVEGDLVDLLAAVDVVVDCTPKKVAARNVEAYREAGAKFVLQGGEKHETTGHSFVAERNYGSAVGRTSTRVVSCNTTSILRTLGALQAAGLLREARGTLMRRTTDPWDSHAGGIVNTLVPEPAVPSHQGPDAQTVMPALDVATMAVAVPETLAHVHAWHLRLTRAAAPSELLQAMRRSTRIVFLHHNRGLSAPNVVKEMAADLGRRRGDLYEVGVWEDLLCVKGDEAFLTYMVDNQAIVIPETVDAIRALGGRQPDGAASIAATDSALGIGSLGMPPPAGMAAAD